MKIPQTNNLVSVIIVTFNSKDYIISCLKALYKSNYSLLEVIVVDNNSSDNTINLISSTFPKVKIIKSNKNLGYAGGNNLGVRKSHGKYIAIINPDTQVTPNWLLPLIEGFKNTNVAICQPKIILLQNKNLVNCTGKITHFLGFEWLKDYKNKNLSVKDQYIDSFSGSIFLTTKLFFIKLGGFDESFFMYYEDGDLSWRTKLLRKQILLVSDSLAYHDYKYIPDENYQTARQKFFLLERNRLIMILKNYSTRTLILILPAIILMELGMIIYFISKGWLRDKIKEYIWIINNSEQIIKKRADIQAGRVIPDKDFIKNFAGRIDYNEVNNPILNLLVNPLLDIYWKTIKNFI